MPSRHRFSRRQPIPVLPCPHARCIELADGVRVCTECTDVLPAVERYVPSHLDGNVIVMVPA